jgi:hypothetical protein
MKSTAAEIVKWLGTTVLGLCIASLLMIGVISAAIAVWIITVFHGNTVMSLPHLRLGLLCIVGLIALTVFIGAMVHQRRLEKQTMPIPEKQSS